MRCGKTPSSRPSTNTTCARRVRARWRSTIATWPGRGGAGAYRRALDRAEELLGREIAAELAPALELVEQPEQRLVGPQVEPGGLGRGRSVQPMGGAEHRRGQLANSGDRGVCGAQALERGDRPAAQLHDLRLQPLRRADAAPAQASLDEVGVGAPEPGVRGADEAEQLSAAAAEPRVAEQREERVPVRGLGDLQRGVERVRDRRARRMPTRAARGPGRATGRRRGSRRERCRRARARRISSATSSSVARVPAPSRKRIAPSPSGAGGGTSWKSARSRWASAGCA